MHFKYIRLEVKKPHERFARHLGAFISLSFATIQVIKLELLCYLLVLDLVKVQFAFHLF